ncbi:hypothetical protein PHLCEN_2v3408 [Hermanssonia centrifuga]|uniref:Uncharacterized protein n=1 Tax=Hermanssonia centrifuga TaxID=98765 RepID=A0A2R6QIT8_9APHY|nr:hypothetical protein PHLCEN_2v3408 [Hermanssonia centrifuga]
MSGIDLNTTIGALLLGGLVSAVQVQPDIYASALLDSFDMCLICHILYWYLVSNYGNPVSLAAPIWSIIYSKFTYESCMF